MFGLPFPRTLWIVTGGPDGTVDPAMFNPDVPVTVLEEQMLVDEVLLLVGRHLHHGQIVSLQLLHEDNIVTHIKIGSDY